MSPIRTLSLLLPLAAGLALLGACSSSAPTTAAPTPPSPAELASRTVEVDSGLWAEDEPAEVAAAEIVEAPAPVEPAPEPQLSTSWTVRRGESIAHFARWAELPVETIAEASDRSLGQALQVGDTLVVPGDGDIRAKVEQARQPAKGCAWIPGRVPHRYQISSGPHRRKASSARRAIAGSNSGV